MTHSSISRTKRALAGIAVGAVVLASTPSIVIAASTWSPTLLVNTESFQTLDEGSGTTDIELRFGGTLNEKIMWSRSLGAFVVTDDLHVQGTLSGAALRVSGPADVQGALTASGTIRTDSDLTINDDAGAVDAVLTFGNATANQTVKFLNASQRFQFSRGVSVIGHMSGSSLNVDRNATVGGSLSVTGSALVIGNLTTRGTLSGANLRVSGPANVQGALSASGTIRTEGAFSGSSLTIDGAFNWRGQTYNAPTSQSSNTFLRTDGAGNLTWQSVSVGNGSGNILSLHPEYPNAIYFQSGSTAVGQLMASGTYLGSDKENFYHWTSTKTTKQDYWIAIRVRVPDAFSSWDPERPIQLRYRTGSGQSLAQGQGSYITVKMTDTAGNPVTLTNGNNLANTSFTTATITGPQAGGTFTPKGYFTVFLKMASSTTPNGTWFSQAGFINMNWETTTP